VSIIHVLGYVLEAKVQVIGLLLVKDKLALPLVSPLQDDKKLKISLFLSSHWFSPKVHLAARLASKTTTVEVLRNKTLAFHNFSAEIHYFTRMESKLSGKYISESAHPTKQKIKDRRESSTNIQFTHFFHCYYQLNVIKNFNIFCSR